MKNAFCLTAFFIFRCSIGFAQPAAKLIVYATAPVATVSPTLYGLMTEEVNSSYDGGLYAEMIRNRTFTPQTDQRGRWRTTARRSAGKR